MIADIHIGGSLYGTLAYNQEKVDAGKGQILDTNRVFVPADGQFSIGGSMRDFELSMPRQVMTTRGIVHISLNPHPEDKLTNDQLIDIGREYIERMGFGGQPWMLFKHEDIDREHLHIVTTRVRGDGTLISDRNNFEKSRRITDDLEKRYGLHPKESRQGEAWQLSPVDAAAGNLKRQVGNVIKPLSEMYRFRSLAEYRALLSLYNIGVEKVEGDNKGHRYEGLVYSVLDGEGNRVGKPLKSSLFGKRAGIAHLEGLMIKLGEAIKSGNTVAGTKATVSAALAGSRTGSEFRAELREKGIDLVLRHNAEGRIYGVTFIDHNSRMVFNGSALGKEFSANALSARFADFSTAHREDPQAPAPQTMDDRNMPPTVSAPAEQSQGMTTTVPMENAQAVPSPTGDERPTTVPTIGEKAQDVPESTDGVSPIVTSEVSSPTVRPATVERDSASRSVIPDLSPVGDAAGSLLSVFTPDAGGQNNGQFGPKKRKKKKRQYGRQT